MPFINNVYGAGFINAYNGVPVNAINQAASDGSFTVTDSGSKEFKPEGQWRYTLYWHLK